MSNMKTLVRPKAPLAKGSFAQPSIQTLDRLGIIFIVLSAAGFATLGIFGKLAYAQGFTMTNTLFWRVTGGAIALWAWLLFQNQWHIRQKDRARALALGAVGYILPTGLFLGALAYASAGITALMFYTYPAFVAIWQWVISRKPLLRGQIIALGIAFSGCLSTVDWHQETVHPLGITLGIAAGCSYGMYMMLSARILRTASPLPTAGYMLLGAALVSIAISLRQQQFLLPATLEQASVAFGLAIIATALPIVLLYSGLRRLDVVPASILSTIEPVLAILMGFFLLRESLWVGQLIGGTLILISALLLNSGRITK